MKQFKLTSLWRQASMTLLFATLSTVAVAQNPNFHIYLAFGESNMVGQGSIEPQDKTKYDNFKVLWSSTGYEVYDETRQTGEWYTAVAPLAHQYAKLSVADYFGRTLIGKLDQQITVGIINVSVASASIRLFDKYNYQTYINSRTETWFKDYVNVYGGNPYGRLIEMAKQAQKVGVIKGIIMHQGEADKDDTDWPNKVKAVYDNIISDLNLGNDIPLLAGEVLRTGVAASANKNIAKLPKQSSNFYVVSSQALDQAFGDGQNMHFTTQEYRDFGKRYADTMIDVLGDKLSPVTSVVVTGVNQPQATEKASSVNFYTIDGLQQTAPLPGIVIMKNSGKTKKVMISPK
jgi:hypothetical protein